MKIKNFLLILILIATLLITACTEEGNTKKERKYYAYICFNENIEEIEVYKITYGYSYIRIWDLDSNMYEIGYNNIIISEKRLNKIFD